MWLKLITQVIAYDGREVEQGGAFFYFMWEFKLVHPLWKAVWCFLEKEPSNTILGHIYSKDAPSYHKDTYTTVFIADLLIIVRNWKQPGCFSTEE